MKKSLFKTLALLCGAVLLCSCGVEEFPGSLLSKNDVPIPIRKDFYDRNGNSVTLTEVLNYRDENKVSICFTDQAGNTCESRYQNGSWLMTSKEFDPADLRQNLPSAVYDALVDRAGNPDNLRFERHGIMMYMRPGFAYAAYEFRATVRIAPGKNAYFFLLVNEDGTVLKDADSFFNYSGSSDNLFSEMDYISGRYPGSVFRAQVNEGGKTLYIIDQDGFRKDVYFDYNSSGWDVSETWIESVWRVEPESVPASARESFGDYFVRYPEAQRFEPDTYFYRETRHGGPCYGFSNYQSATEYRIVWVSAEE